MKGVKEIEKDGQSGHEVVSTGEVFLGIDSYTRACSRNGQLIHEDNMKKEEKKAGKKPKKKKKISKK